MYWIFGIFFIFKSIAFNVQFFSYIKRYWQTYKTLNQVEIWIFLLTAIKMTVVVPDYWFYEINWLFWVFVVNSAVTFWMSHLLHMRTFMVRKGSVCEGRCIVAWFVIRIILIIAIIFIGPIYDNWIRGSDHYYSFILKCSNDAPYPIRFALIFLLDFVAATVDFIIFACRPKTQGSKKRLREMRIATIEAGIAERRDTTLKMAQKKTEAFDSKDA